MAGNAGIHRPSQEELNAAQQRIIKILLAATETDRIVVRALRSLAKPIVSRARLTPNTGRRRSPFGEKSGVQDEETLMRVSSDVTLVVRKDDGSYNYSVCVGCRVPGTRRSPGDRCAARRRHDRHPHR